MSNDSRDPQKPHQDTPQDSAPLNGSASAEPDTTGTTQVQRRAWRAADSPPAAGVREPGTSTGGPDVTPSQSRPQTVRSYTPQTGAAGAPAASTPATAIPKTIPPPALVPADDMDVTPPSPSPAKIQGVARAFPVASTPATPVASGAPLAAPAPSGVQAQTSMDQMETGAQKKRRAFFPAGKHAASPNVARQRRWQPSEHRKLYADQTEGDEIFDDIGDWIGRFFSGLFRPHDVPGSMDLQDRQDPTIVRSNALLILCIICQF